MAEEIVIPRNSKTLKIRNPWGVLGLSLITLGIYAYFWWYFINRELRDVGQTRATKELGTTPGVSTLAYVTGSFLLVVPLIWTVITTSQRVRRAQRLAGSDSQLNPWIATPLWIFTLTLGGLVYTQAHLNRAWRTGVLTSDAGQLEAAGLTWIPPSGTGPELTAPERPEGVAPEAPPTPE